MSAAHVPAAAVEAARADACAAVAPGGAAKAGLFAMVALAPVVVPSGPGQMAVVDVLNVAAMVAFVLGLRRGGAPVRLPFLLPLLLIAAGSLLATTNAGSLRAGGLTLAQDLYLYLWLVLLVHWLHASGDLRALRLAWLWTANAIAAIGLALFWAGAPAGEPWASGGARAAATFYNPNMFADYLALSVFNLLGLLGRVRLPVFAGSLALLLGALVATKSNGGWISLGAGLAVWAIARPIAAGVPPSRLAGTAALAVGALVLGIWAHQEWGLGENALRQVARDSFVGRIEHSSESRRAIWRVLETEFARSPLGIGPGNTAGRPLPIGERERPGSFEAKEAHSDYLAYAAERGPLGFAGLVLGVVQAFAAVLGGAGTLVRRTGATREGRALQAALLAALVCTTVHSFVIEKLHFRHEWLFLAMVCALTDRRSADGAAVPVLGAPEGARRFAASPVPAGRPATDGDRARAWGART